MPTRPCPKCHTPNVRRLDSVNHDAHVDYYRCEACGHVWHTPKAKPDGPISDVIIDIPTDDS